MSSEKSKPASENSQCGIVMPISPIDGCDASHWADVLEILQDAIESAGFTANLVSNADEVGLIHKRIIHNLYENPIVVCDVSAKNANVMFELGLRLAFDKPTIIVKDDRTTYSFDTANIEHLEYPRDLRFTKIVDFKQKLADKIQATIMAAKEDPNYTTFLKHFGEFKVAKLKEKEVGGQEIIMEEISALRQEIKAFRTPPQRPLLNPLKFDICYRNQNASTVQKIFDSINDDPDLYGIAKQNLGPNHFHIIGRIKSEAGTNRMEVEKKYRLQTPSEAHLRLMRKHP